MSEGEQVTPYGKVEPDYYSRKHFPAGTPITPADGSTKSIEDITTPGHRFLTETGDYMEIGHMLRLGGGNVRLVEQDGTVITATGEVREHRNCLSRTA